MDPGEFLSLEKVQELLQELLQELSSGCTEELLQRGLERRELLDSGLLDGQRRARGLAEELAQAQASLAQQLQAAQAEVQRLRGRSRELDTELARAQGSLSTARDRTRELRQALQELQEQLGRLERDEDEDEEQPGLPADVYVAQLYYEISRIDWDYSAEPGWIRGTHHGPPIAVPLELEASRLSGTFVSDFLWGLVPTQWGPRRPPAPPAAPSPN